MQMHTVSYTFPFFYGFCCSANWDPDADVKAREFSPTLSATNESTHMANTHRQSTMNETNL